MMNIRGIGSKMKNWGYNELYGLVSDKPKAKAYEKHLDSLDGHDLLKLEMQLAGMEPTKGSKQQNYVLVKENKPGYQDSSILEILGPLKDYMKEKVEPVLGRMETFMRDYDKKPVKEKNKNKSPMSFPETCPGVQEYLKD